MRDQGAAKHPPAAGTAPSLFGLGERSSSFGSPDRGLAKAVSPRGAVRRTRRSRAVGGIGRTVLGRVLLVAVLLALPVPALLPAAGLGPSLGPGSLASGATPLLTSSVSATAALGHYLGTHGANAFWGVEFTDDNTPTRVLAAAGAFLNTTPIDWFRFGGDGAAYDPTTQTLYAPPPSGSGTFVATSQELWNYTWFRSFCVARPTCYWLASLPGEENDTVAATHYAKWFHTVLHLAPTRWEFGNEPTQWKDYGVNITMWSTSALFKPTGTGYATMVANYEKAVAHLYPKDRFVGLEAACACNKLMAEDTASMDHAVLSSMAYHSYPTVPGSNTSLSAFYSTLWSASNITTTSARYRTNVDLKCSACAALPIELGEYQAGPFSAFSPFSQTYAGAPWVLTSAMEALYSNLSMFSVFDWNSLYNASSSNVTWEGKVYQRLLPNLTMGADYAVTVKAGGVGGIESILIENGTHESLLLVNTNQTYSLKLALTTALFPVGATGSEWSWHPGQSLPAASRGITLPTSYAVPAQGILLLDNY